MDHFGKIGLNWPGGPKKLGPFLLFFLMFFKMVPHTGLVSFELYSVDQTLHKGLRTPYEDEQLKLQLQLQLQKKKLNFC